MKRQFKIISAILTAALALSSFAFSAAATALGEAPSMGSDPRSLEKSLTLTLDKGDVLEFNTRLDYDEAKVCSFQVEVYADSSDLEPVGEPEFPNFDNVLNYQTTKIDKLAISASKFAARDTIDLSGNPTLSTMKFKALRDCTTTIDYLVKSIYVTVKLDENIEDISSVLDYVDLSNRFKINGYTIGDVNCDGHVTIADAILVQKHIVSILKLSGSDLTLADTDMSGGISIADAIQIQKAIVGIISLY